MTEEQAPQGDECNHNWMDLRVPAIGWIKAQGQWCRKCGTLQNSQYVSKPPSDLATLRADLKVMHTEYARLEAGLGSEINLHNQAEADLKRVEGELGNLLAIIHRDGGHYVAEYGLEKAVSDAHQVWAQLRQDSESLAEAVRQKEGLEQERDRLRGLLRKRNMGDVVIGLEAELTLAQRAVVYEHDAKEGLEAALTFVTRETVTSYCMDCGILTYFEKDGEAQHEPGCAALSTTTEAKDTFSYPVKPTDTDVPAEAQRE